MEDALATITEVTARCIVDALRFVQEERVAVEIVVSGGGAFNSYLLDRIAERAPEAKVCSSAEVGIHPQAKEAVAFAFFAKARIDETMIHLPSTTGASRKTILGSLSRG
jgi:anhydro-N-acetylmuramic acid kinase